MSDMPHAIALGFLLVSLTAKAFELPTGMDHDHQLTTAEILAPGTSTKQLTNPYPLGGYSGFEMGISAIVLDVTTIKNLNPELNRNSLTLAQLGFAKGLYNNLDLHFNFSPFSGPSGETTYGGLLKWGFYQADTLPLNMAVSGHYSSFTIGNRFASSVLGMDLIAGFNFTSIAFYLGIGFVDCYASFMGGGAGVSATESGETENLRFKKFHSVLGTTYHFDPFFIAFEIDRYSDFVSSAKFGTRF